ncbi:hypothetical protein [Fulvimonas soli]|jgi:hypothetical protein|uniref:Lipoprotein n=1 Tax=Fulvimonas soli TaxID=155197 RepID=A0A316HX99_9GAMM|nr:hypothetical protein [Fulvimonas soli]PWK85285.1 hypothetical protein C7456_10959 [Fulvimonas soli]TNY26289.1 hypothetical protein BV497_09535 [Fulvimonas soli]
MRTRRPLSVLLALALAGCGRRAGDAPAAPPGAAAHREAAAYVDERHGFRIALPADAEVRHDFRRGYFDDAGWKSYAAPGSRGEALLALVVPGSNGITAAELRIGASAQPSEVARCTAPPAGAGGETGHVRVGDGDFVRFHAADAAMSHYLDVEAYRAVHAGRCYAIDLWIAGTDPQVYEPPATPPFDRRQALQRMRGWLGGFRFTR